MRKPNRRKNAPRRKSNNRFFSGIFNFKSPGSVALAVFGMMVAGTMLLHMKANAGLPRWSDQRLVLNAIPADFQDGYMKTGSFVGRLEPARKTQLAFELSGLVLKVLRQEGDRVKSGDVIAILDTSKLTATRNQLKAQRRALDAKKKLSEATLQRKKKLRNKGWGTAQRFDEAGAKFAELSASIERIEAEINALDIDVKKSKLLAPFDGVISSRQIHEGAVIGVGTPVATLLEDGKRQVRIGLPPKVAQTLEATREYKLTAGEKSLYGKLAVLRPDLNTDTRTVSIVMDVFGADEVPFGEIVTLEVKTKISEPGTWLPLTALTEGRKGLWNVMVVEDDSRQSIVRSEVVEVLYAKEQSVYVRGTFPNNALIVLNGSNRVTSGQSIAVAKEKTCRLSSTETVDCFL